MNFYLQKIIYRHKVWLEENSIGSKKICNEIALGCSSDTKDQMLEHW